MLELNSKEAIFSDSEIITICIVSELLTINSEKLWFQFVKGNFKNLFACMCLCTPIIKL